MQEDSSELYALLFGISNKMDVKEWVSKVRMLADTCGDLAKALDLQLDLAAVLGSMRCKRFSMLVDDGTVAKVNIEPDGKNFEPSLVIPRHLLTRVFLELPKYLNFLLRHWSYLQPGRQDCLSFHCI